MLNKNLKIYRGISKNPSDSGDLGIGEYWTTDIHYAKQYGTIKKGVLDLKNPLIMNKEQAVKLINKFKTLTGNSFERSISSKKLTEYIKNKGYDGIIAKGYETLPDHYVIVKFLNESIYQKDMPQIKKDQVDDILQLFDEYGIGYEKGVTTCSKLKAIQDKYIPKKVENMKSDIKNNKINFSYIFVSKDGFILDGHHRWLAIKELYGDSYKIPIIKVNLLKWQALYIFSKNIENLSDSNIIVSFAGRFQPFHSGHYYIYNHLINKFKKNVYIVTSNKVKYPECPFNFKDKKNIINTLFNVSDENIIHMKFPYRKNEYQYFGNLDTFSLIIAISSKDKDRFDFNGGYYKEYVDNLELKKANECCYIYIIPVENDINSTEIRNNFKTDDDQFKTKYFINLYKNLNTDIYNLFDSKLNKRIQLSENSITGNDIDDGQDIFYKNINNYKTQIMKILKTLPAWDILDYITGNKDQYSDYNYKTDYQKEISFGNVSFGNTGLRLKKGDILRKYQNFIEKVATQSGYDVIDWILGYDKKNSIIQDKVNIVLEPIVKKSIETKK